MLWGIDLGGTKIEGVVLNNQHMVLARERVPTEAHMGISHIVGQIRKVINILSEEVGEQPTQIGIGTPGTIDPHTGLLKNSNTQAINNQPFLEELKKAINIPVKIANDANCFALAETKMGAVAEKYPEAKVVFGVIMGTGVGGGIVINGQILEGRQGIGGEWGHTFLDRAGGVCYCGKKGCVERIIAGPSLERYYFENTGSKKNLKEIYSLYKTKSDRNAVQTIERMIHFFGIGLSNVINILDPDVIVLGGGVSNLDVLYTEGKESVRRNVFNPSFDTPIIPPLLGDSAGVFGAAFL